jgi:hypothetical protein
MQNLFTRVAIATGLLSVGSWVSAQTTDPPPSPPTAVAPTASGPVASRTGPQPSSSSAVTESNTQLAAVLPPNMSTKEACLGFSSLPLCAATLHASQNLGIGFHELKVKVTGGETLEAAIRTLRPDVDARSEMMKARQQAVADLQSAPTG